MRVQERACCSVSRDEAIEQVSVIKLVLLGSLGDPYCGLHISLLHQASVVVALGNMPPPPSCTAGLGI